MSDLGRPVDPVSGAPTPVSVARRLEGFVGEVVQARQPELRELIEALRSPGLRDAQQWAHIDLVTAFDPPTAIHGRDRASSFWRGVATYGVFVPLVLTWLGLHQAIRAFERMPADDRPGNFFESWIRGFPSEYAGFLGPFNSLSWLAVLTATLFVLLIVAGSLAESAGRDTDDRRAEFRGALTDAMRLLDVRFPESPAAAAAVMEELAEQIRTAREGSAKTQQSLLDTQAEVLRATSDAVVGMTGRLADQHEEATARLRAASEQYQQDLAGLHAEALRTQRDLLASLNAGLAQCSEAMVEAGALVSAMANHTRDELSRTTDYDRILTHVADSALRIREAADLLESGRRHLEMGS